MLKSLDWLFILLCPCVDKGFLMHLDPFHLIYADGQTAFTFYHITVVYCIVTLDTLLPTMQNPSLADLQIFEQLALAFSTFDR